jgi:hypothetical protein
MNILLLLLAIVGLDVPQTTRFKTDVVAVSASSVYLRWEMGPIAGFPVCASNKGRSCLLGFTLANTTSGKVLGNPGYGPGNIGPTVTSFRSSLPCGTSTFSIDAVVVDGMGRQFASAKQYISYTRNC